MWASVCWALGCGHTLGGSEWACVSPAACGERVRAPGGVHLCRSGFLVEVQMVAFKARVTCGPTAHFLGSCWKPPPTAPAAQSRPTLSAGLYIFINSY